MNLDLTILKNILANKKNGLDFVADNNINLFSVEYFNFATEVFSYVKSFKETPTLNVLCEKFSKNAVRLDNIKKIWSLIELESIDEKEFKFNVEKLKRRFAEKQILNIQDNLNKLDPNNLDVSKTISEISKVTQNIKDLHTIKTYDSKNIKDYLPEFIDKFNHKKKNPKEDAGLMTKYSAFDLATNGLRDSDYVLVCAESGFGKSLLLNNMAVQTWMQNNTVNSLNFSQGKNIIYFSLEMPYEDCFNRLISLLSLVPSRKIENATLTKEEYHKVKQAIDFIKIYPYDFKIVDISEACSNDLENVIIDYENKLDAVFVDYLGIMKPNGKAEDSDWLTQGVISYEIRAIARKFKLPIFSAVQLNRKAPGKDPSENIGLNRLARSATIATHATHVIQIENTKNSEYDLEMKLHIIKNRRGNKLSFNLYKNLACAALIDKKAEVDENDMFKDMEDISDDIDDLNL